VDAEGQRKGTWGTPTRGTWRERNINIDEWDDRPGRRVLTGHHPGAETGTSLGVAGTLERKQRIVKRPRKKEGSWALETAWPGHCAERGLLERDCLPGGQIERRPSPAKPNRFKPKRLYLGHFGAQGDLV
jgi:hypothetical protein